MIIYVASPDRSFDTGSAGHAIGYHSKPDDNAGDNNKIVFVEKVRMSSFTKPVLFGTLPLPSMPTLPQALMRLIIWQCEFAFNIMSPLALGFIKLSILFFYRRIFRGRTFDILSWTLITLVVLWTLGFFLVQVFDCRTHFSTNWGTLADLQKCLSSFKQLLACSISDFIMDLFILVLPIPLVSVVKAS
jgi:hypothetical protein